MRCALRRKIACTRRGRKKSINQVGPGRGREAERKRESTVEVIPESIHMWIIHNGIMYALLDNLYPISFMSIEHRRLIVLTCYDLQLILVAYASLHFFYCHFIYPTSDNSNPKAYYRNVGLNQIHQMVCGIFSACQ